MYLLVSVNTGRPTNVPIVLQTVNVAHALVVGRVPMQSYDTNSPDVNYLCTIARGRSM